VKCATWYTQYGRLDLLFWTTGPEPANENETGKTNRLASTSCARIDLFTKSITKSSMVINLDFNQANSIPFELTYQAMVPNDSEIWNIIEDGDVEALKKALVMQTASLTDRDENGRSYLSVSITLDSDSCAI
jgi:hypothetical protein